MQDNQIAPNNRLTVQCRCLQSGCLVVVLFRSPCICSYIAPSSLTLICVNLHARNPSFPLEASVVSNVCSEKSCKVPALDLLWCLIQDPYTFMHSAAAYMHAARARIYPPHNLKPLSHDW